MTQAENYKILFDGGNKTQAENLAENMSIWETQDWDAKVTVFGFADCSAIYVRGSEFRVVTPEEIEVNKW